MRFAHPQILWLLLAVGAFGFWAWLRTRGGRKALEEALGPVMAVRLTSHLRWDLAMWARLLPVVALGLLVLAAARPQRGSKVVEATRKGVDVIVCLDVSESMMAEDLRPSRLERARHEIARLIDLLKGDRLGLVAFAGAAFVQCPLTLDYAAAKMFLEYMTPDLIPEPGTDLGEAISVAVRAFGEDEQSAGTRALVLISDGEDHGQGLEAALEKAQRARVRIFAVGIGSEEGEPIPVYDEAGNFKGHKRDRQGKVVLTRLDEESLKRAAAATGGLYVRAGASLGLERVAAEIEKMEKRELKGGLRILYEDRYAYFVWPALLLLAIEWVLPLRRRERPGRIRLTGGSSSVALVVALVVLSGAFVSAPAAGSSAGPSPQVPSGGSPPPPSAVTARVDSSRLEEIGRLMERNRLFHEKHPLDPRPLYNMGNLSHEAGDLTAAEDFYKTAAPRARGQLASRLAYNLGTTLLKEGKLEEAISSFAEALRLDPENEDAKYNLELAALLLQMAQSQADSSACPNPQGSQRQGDSEKQQDQQKEQQDGSNQQEGENQPQRNQQSGGQEQQESEEKQGQDRTSADSTRAEPPSPQSDSAWAQSQPEQGDSLAMQPPARASRQSAEGDSAVSLDQLQIDRILRALEESEKRLLRRRFRARSKNIEVEKDW